MITAAGYKGLTKKNNPFLPINGQSWRCASTPQASGAKRK